MTEFRAKPQPDPAPGERDGEVRTLDFGPRRFLSALVLVLVLAIAGAAVGIVSRGGALDLAAPRPPDPRFLLLALAITVADLFLGGWRLHVLAHRIEPKVRLRDCLRANLGNYCLAGLTPSQAGGGAAQLYLLARAGLPWRGGVAIAAINFLVSVLVLALAGVVALVALHDALPGWLQMSTTGTVAVLGALVLVIGALLRWGRFAPDPRRLTQRGRIRRWFAKSQRFLHDSLEVARELFREHPRRTAATVPLTAAIYGAKLAFTFAVFRAFCPEGHLEDMVGALIVLILALYFAPTPGASGLAEGATTAYLAGAIGTSAAAGFALWWRTLALYLPVMAGGLVILRQLAVDAKGISEAKRRTERRAEERAQRRAA